MNVSLETETLRFAPAAGEKWFVCHARPRCEKKLAALLQAEKMVHYLPLVPSIRHYGRQTKRFTKPLFPGYVFARIPLDRKQRIYQQELVARTITPDDENVFLEQLQQVRRVVDAGLELTLHPNLTQGMRVRVVSGPLRGIEGVIDNSTNPLSIIVSMDVLQQGVRVKIPIEALEPLS